MRYCTATMSELGKVVRLKSTPCDDWTSFSLVDLEIELEDGTVLRLLLKDLGLKNLHETARQIKPGFLYNPLREIKTYEEILAPNCFGTAHYYGAVVRSDEDRFWLFLEKLSGLRICAVNDFCAWLEAARWLARLHARFMGEGNTLKRSVSSAATRRCLLPAMARACRDVSLWRDDAVCSGIVEVQL